MPMASANFYEEAQLRRSYFRVFPENAYFEELRIGEVRRIPPLYEVG